MQQKQLQQNFLTPTVSQDGAVIAITDGTNIPTINFFQARQEDAEHLHVDVVASVRFNGIVELVRLKEQIETTIKQHTDREQ